MPKVKIGEKVVIGEQKQTEIKRFNNGHKSFTSEECRALLELQSTEKRAAESFERRKYDLIRDRNPITGDITPREHINSKGEVTLKTGDPIFKTSTIKTRSPEEIEQQEEELRLKNQNPLKRSDRVEERIHSLQNRQDMLGGEIAFLRDQITARKNHVPKKNTRPF
jgi:chaperonin cofactor prefoldin